MKKNNKKAVIEQLMPLVTALVGIGVVLVVGFLIMAQIKTQVVSLEGLNSSGQNGSGIFTSQAFNGTSDVQNAMQDIPGWLPIIVVTVIGALLLGLVRFFRTA